jgi:hypothetical protein
VSQRISGINSDVTMQSTHGRICDLALLLGDIEVDTNEDTLSLEVKVSNGQFV